MFYFFRRYRSVVIIVFFLMISFMILLSHSRQRPPIWHENLLIFLSAPLQLVASTVGGTVGGLVDRYVFLAGRYEENLLLRKENLRLRGENFRLKEIEQENMRMRDLLNFKKRAESAGLLPAEVIAIDSRSDFKSIRVNRGTRDGVKEQFPVVTSEGIVGQVLRAYTHFSDVLLITDGYSAVDAVVQRSRSRGILEGSIVSCVLKHVLRSDDVKNGDLIISTGLDRVFPRGLPLGYVSNVSKEKYGIVQKVMIDPVVDFSRLEEVLIVLKQNTESALEGLISDRNEEQ